MDGDCFVERTERAQHEVFERSDLQFSTVRSLEKTVGMSLHGVPLFVLGKSRVGKGEFIKTAVYKLAGRELDITSDRMESHTKQSTGYPVALGGRAVELTDTMGYDDTQGDDASEAAFLQLLARTGSSPYYPPLVILQALCGSDMAWLKKITSVFPSIVCAVRGQSKNFRAAKESLADSEFKPLRLFHLREYCDEEEDEGRSRAAYLENVMSICEFYTALSPSREKLSYDEEIFQGKIERIKIETETKTEDLTNEVRYVEEEDAIVKNQRIVTIDDGGHYVEKEVRRDDFERWIEGIKTFYILGVGGWSETKTVKEWVKDTKETVVEESGVEKLNVNFIERTTTRSFYQRNQYEVWKVLTNGIKIFMNREKSEWEKMDEKVIDVSRKKA